MCPAGKRVCMLCLIKSSSQRRDLAIMIASGDKRRGGGISECIGMPGGGRQGTTSGESVEGGGKPEGGGGRKAELLTKKRGKGRYY